MKITVLLLTLNLVSISASVYSQNMPIALSTKDMNIKDVIREIESQTNYRFVYSASVVIDQKVSLKSSSIETLNGFLDEVIKDMGLNYQILENNLVVITSKNDKFFVQEITIKGKVTDIKGYSLPGVNIVEKGTTNGSVTDLNGEYSISVSSQNAILSFSYVGYLTEEMDVAGKSTIDVSLVEDITSLEEVVVVGYGTQKKVNLTGSIDVVSGEELANRPSPNVSLLLQGASPGVNISYSGYGGEPGAVQNWQIRGVGSISVDENDKAITDDSPLILVDGVEMDVNLIDPESVESISVLKDASASAIYGARGAYGVVLITTKKGSKNQSMQIQYTNNISIAKPIYVPDMYDSYTYAIAFNQARANAGLAPKFPEEQVERILGYQEGTYPYEYDPDNPPYNLWRGRHDGNANNNWTKLYWKNSLYQKHNISLTGGDAKTSYYFNAGYFDQPGQYNWGDDGYKRYNIVANVSTKINDWIGFDFSTKYARTETDVPLGMVGTSRRYMWAQFMDFWPTMPMYNIDGTISNPLIHVLESGGRIITEKHDMWMNLGFNIEPVKGWVTSVRYNYNYRWGDITKDPKPVYVPIPDGSTGNIGEATTGYDITLNRGQYNLVSTTSSYEHQLGNHYFKVIVGYEQDYDYRHSLNSYVANLITETVPSLVTATGEYSIDEEMSHWATRGIFGRLNYNYKEKILFEFSSRYDGSSKFAKDSRWGFFPSASFGYNIAKEEFWTPVSPYVNSLKIRASYGELGNQNVKNYLYLSSINTKYRQDLSSTYYPGYIIGDDIPFYATMPDIVSDDLTWETITTLDFGLDAGFFQNRLNIVFDWFNRTTYDMVGPSEDLSSVLGVVAPVSNNAELSTKGIELSVIWRDRITSNLSYNLKLNLSNYKTTILKYLNETGKIGDWYEGKVYGDVWGLTTDGLIQEEGEDMPDQTYYHANWGPGDMKYKDLNGDGLVTPGARTLDDHGDLSVIGNTTPKYNFGITAGVNWKNFDFSMFWQGVAKCDFMPELWTEYFVGLTTSPNNSALLKGGPSIDYWRPADETNFLGSNTDAYLPKPYFSSEKKKNYQTQTRYLLNAAYIRLKNLQLGYTVPSEILDKVKLKNARIYFSGENLLTFSALPDLLEPELSIVSQQGNGGYDLGTIYPISQMFSFGLTVTF